MRRALGFFLTSGLYVSLFVCFVGLASVLHVRSAIAEGALEAPGACLVERDSHKLRAGPDQQLADWWISRQVYEFRVGDNRSPGLGWRGALANFGMKLAMSPSERIDLAYASMRPLRLCGRPPNIARRFSAAST
jgi:hypothetical protein